VAKKLLSLIDLARIGADPATTGLVGGEIYFRTSDNVIRLYNGSAWTSLGTAVASATSFFSQAKWGVD